MYVLGFDGAFMKGPFPGQLLTAVGIDPNNGIFPLAYGIVETESRESWTWFLQHLKDDLDLEDNSNFTFISDRQKVMHTLCFILTFLNIHTLCLLKSLFYYIMKQGIIPAIAELFPVAEHRYCLMHIYENMKLRWA